MSQNLADTIIYHMKAKLAPLPREWIKRGRINCQKCIIDLTYSSRYRCFSSMCKWYLLFVSDNFVEKKVLKIANWIYILLGNNHLSNVFAKVITIKILFSLTKLRWVSRAASVFEGLKYKVSSMVIQSRSGCQYWVGQSGITTTTVVVF